MKFFNFIFYKKNLDQLVHFYIFIFHFFNKKLDQLAHVHNKIAPS